MAEPSTAAVGIVSACAYQAGATIVDPAFSMPLDAVIVGFVACIGAQLHMRPKDGAGKPLLTVFSLAVFASFMAGLFSAPMASAFIDNLGCLPGISAHGMRLCASALIGVTFHILPAVAPDLYKRAATRWIGSSE
jgi:hypothetical protein